MKNPSSDAHESSKTGLTRSLFTGSDLTRFGDGTLRIAIMAIPNLFFFTGIRYDKTWLVGAMLCANSFYRLLWFYEEPWLMDGRSLKG